MNEQTCLFTYLMLGVICSLKKKERGKREEEHFLGTRQGICYSNRVGRKGLAAEVKEVGSEPPRYITGDVLSKWKSKSTSIKAGGCLAFSSNSQ